jgi:peroxiredoxin
MKNLHKLMTVLLITSGISIKAQNSFFPSVKLTTPEGVPVNASAIRATSRPMVIVFWNSDDRKSLEQVKMINEESDPEVFVLGILSSQSGTPGSLRALVNGLNLNFPVLIDKNDELKRAMGIPEAPYTLLYEPEQDSIRRISGFCLNLDKIINLAGKDYLAKSNRIR